MIGIDGGEGGRFVNLGFGFILVRRKVRKMAMRAEVVYQKKGDCSSIF